MKSLVLHPEFQLYERKDNAFCSSLQVAEEFRKEHKNVLTDIRNLDCSDGFRELNFQQILRIVDLGQGRTRKDPLYLMTKDGFMYLCFGYRGEKVAAIKEAYIARFNQYEDFIKKYLMSREDFALFTQAVQDAHNEPQSYHYSNEVNMINRIVLGVDAKHFKLLHGIPADVPSIRPYLTLEQSKAIRKMQIEDIRLLYKGYPFQERKSALTGFYSNLALGG